jgi:PTS system nitrogen regulatory IIA component
MVEVNNIRFSSLFEPSEVICQTEQTSRDQVLMDMLRLLSHKAGIGDIDEAYRAVVERENEIPTLVAPGMAMPHARLENLKGLVVAVATSRQGIVYDPQRADDPAKLIVLTLAPKASPGAYLQAISCLAAICKDPSTAEVVAGLTTPEQVWSFFDKGGTVPGPAPIEPFLSKILRE